MDARTAEDRRRASRGVGPGSTPETMTIFIDECGFTGEDLLAPEQPVFVLVSSTITDEVASELMDRHFGKIKSKELKHRDLAHRSSNHPALIAFQEEVAADHRDEVYVAAFHKPYVLLSKYVDYLVENVAREDGWDLYKDGRNIGLSNLLFAGLPNAMGPSQFAEFLRLFQDAGRKKGQEEIMALMNFVRRARSGGAAADLLTYVQIPWARFGPSAAEYLMAPKMFDLALAGALVLVEYWANRSEMPIRLVHDESRNLEQDRDLWDALTSASMPAATVGRDRRTLQFPIGLAETQFESSKSRPALQFCDILAGSLFYGLRAWIQGDSSEYPRSSLRALGNVNSHFVWPSAHVTPAELGTAGRSRSDALEFISENVAEELLRRAARGRRPPGGDSSDGGAKSR